MEHPTIDQMEQELVRAGWKRKMIGIWSSPEGKLFHGPYYAWKVMRGLEKSSQLGR